MTPEQEKAISDGLDGLMAKSMPLVEQVIRKQMRTVLETMALEIHAQNLVIEQLRKDAERYRWVRNVNNDDDAIHFVSFFQCRSAGSAYRRSHGRQQ